MFGSIIVGFTKSVNDVKYILSLNLLMPWKLTLKHYNLIFDLVYLSLVFPIFIPLDLAPACCCPAVSLLILLSFVCTFWFIKELFCWPLLPPAVLHLVPTPWKSWQKLLYWLHYSVQFNFICIASITVQIVSWCFSETQNMTLEKILLTKVILSNPNLKTKW